MQDWQGSVRGQRNDFNNLSAAQECLLRSGHYPPPPGAPCQLAGGRNTLGKHSASQIALSQEGVPALFGGVVSLDFINTFAMDRTKANMNPPTAVPYITEAGT
jgi:hypothetical protein